MDADVLAICSRLAGALVVGALLGLDRTIRARPAGFRTHAIVCMSCALVMIAASMQSSWLETPELDEATPSRIIQGLVTGIGFLGAGVIFKDGLTVRGLTTAANIWMTAAIGILIGIGFWLPAIVAALLTLLVLTVLGKLEDRLPTEYHAHCQVRFSREEARGEAEMRRLAGRHGLEVADLYPSLINEGRQYEVHMVIRGKKAESAQSLAGELMKTAGVLEFRISPRGD